MFSELIDNVRNLRDPLWIGYMFVLACWLAAGDKVPSNPDDPVLVLIQRALSEFGTAPKVGLATFLALFLGSFICGLLAEIHCDVDWPPGLQSTKSLMEEVEIESYYLPDADYQKVDPKGHLKSMTGIASAIKKLESDYKFRWTLATASLMPILIAPLVGGWRWLWALAWPVLALVHAWIIHAKLEDQKGKLRRLHERKSLYAQCRDLSDTLCLIGSNAPGAKAHKMKSQMLANRMGMIWFSSNLQVDDLVGLKAALNPIAEYSGHTPAVDLSKVEAEITSLESKADLKKS